jgi:hypothetical protein
MKIASVTVRLGGSHEHPSGYGKVLASWGEWSDATWRGQAVQPLRIESKNSALFFTARSLSTRNSVASRSSMG